MIHTEKKANSSNDQKEGVVLLQSVAKQNSSTLGVKFVRLLFIDNTNLRRCRVIPWDRFNSKEFKFNGVGLCVAVMSMPFMFDQALEGPSGELQLVPDMSTFRQLPYYPSHGICMVNMSLNGEVWNRCARSLLRRKIHEMKDRFGVELKVGFETEFMLFKPEVEGGTDISRMAPLDSTLYCESRSLNREVAELMDKITDYLTKQSVSVLQYHSESASGQFEISTAPYDPLTAADNVVLTRETIAEAAHESGLRATLIPKYSTLEAGNASHVHISLNAPKESTGSLELEQLAEHFFAGVLDRLDALHGLLLPSMASYDRAQPSCWAGVFKCWGVQNREAPIRAIEEQNQIVRYEIKSIDATSNPYLALAGIISAGAHGMENRMTLPEPITSDPATIQTPPPRLPCSLDQALRLLEKDQILLHGMGHEVVNSFVKTKFAEYKHMSEMHSADRRNLFMQRY